MDEDVKCQQCKSIPIHFVVLDCEHTFCLFCLQQAFHQNDGGVVCLLCNHPTILDEETLDILRDQKQQQQQQQPINIKPYTTEYRQPLRQTQECRGHPFIEKLNVALERSLDTVRNLQFDKLAFREKCQQMRSQMSNEFKSLHQYLDEKQTTFLNQLSQIELACVSSITNREENQEIEVQEIQLMKQEINHILMLDNDLNEDIDRFKQVLNQVDSIAQSRSLTYNQLNEQKAMQDELNRINKSWSTFYQDYRSFFSTQGTSNPTPFISASRLDRVLYQKSSSQSYLQDILSTPNNGNSFLNEQITKTRRFKDSVVKSRIVSASPMNAKMVLQNSIYKSAQQSRKTNSFLMSQFTCI